MKSNNTKEKCEEKEEQLNTPKHAAVLASTSGTTAATKEDVAILRHTIEEAGGQSYERMQEMRELIRSMMATVQRQPNMSKDVKNALPRQEAIIDYMEEAKRDENEKRKKLTSFAAISGRSSNKRQVFASPLAPLKGAKLAKKKRGGATIPKPSSEEWTVVQKDKKKSKRDGNVGKEGNTLPDPKTSIAKKSNAADST